MHIIQPTYLTIVVATHPAEPDEYAAPIIFGFGMFAISKLEADGWRFGLSSGVADTLDDEERVLTELADALPHPRFLLGYDIEHRISRPVAIAADRVSPIVAAHVRQRMARLLSALPVDVALPSGGPMSLNPIVDVAVYGQTIVDPVAVRNSLERAAIGLCLRFLGQPSPDSCGSSGIATITWLGRRENRR
jgi:hypothetical protein